MDNSIANNSNHSVTVQSLITREIKATVYFILMVSGLVCNSLVIAVIAKNEHLQKSINYFILNMAVSDLLVPMFSISERFVRGVTDSGEWKIHGDEGLVLCKLVHFLSDLSPLVSILSLVFMTVDRFIAIVYPTKFKLRTPTVRKRLLILSWLIPVFYCSKNFYSYKLTARFLCGQIWEPAFDHEYMSTVVTTFYTVAFIFTPLVVLTVLYSLILSSLRRQDLVHQHATTNRGILKLRQKQRRRVIKCAFTIVLAFSISYGPLYFYIYIVHSFVTKWKAPTKGFSDKIFICYLLAYCNATINPLICMAFHKEIRICVRQLFPCRVQTKNAGSFELTGKDHVPQHHDSADLPTTLSMNVVRQM